MLRALTVWIRTEGTFESEQMKNQPQTLGNNYMKFTNEPFLNFTFISHIYILVTAQSGYAM